jgi:hypothetical protein
VANPDRLRHILLYHVHQGPRLRAADLRDGPVTTLQGGPVRVDVGDDGVVVNASKVLAADVEAVNGILHVIDTVLIPGDGFTGLSLSIEVQAGTATVVWPAGSGTPPVLEAASSPAGPWSPVAGPTVTADGVTKTSLEASAGQQFFRVRQ